MHKSFTWADKHYQASFLVDPLLVSRSGRHPNHSRTCELQMAVRPSQYDHCCHSYREAREARNFQNSKVSLGLRTMSSLEERTLEEFYSLRLFLCDLHWFACSSGIIVCLARKIYISGGMWWIQYYMFSFISGDLGGTLSQKKKFNVISWIFIHINLANKHDYKIGY